MTEIQTIEMPATPEVADVMRRMDAVAESQHSLCFTAAELSLLSSGLEGLKRAVARRMREADDGELDGLANMIAQIGVVEKRLQTTLSAAMTQEFGEAGPPDLTELIQRAQASVQERRPQAEFSGGMYL